MADRMLCGTDYDIYDAVDHQQHRAKRPAPKTRARPEAMLMFGLRQLSPHALSTLVNRHGATQWTLSQPTPFEAFLGDKFNEAMIAHILQQVHSYHMAGPQSGKALELYLRCQHIERRS